MHFQKYIFMPSKLQLSNWRLFASSSSLTCEQNSEPEPEGAAARPPGTTSWARPSTPAPRWSSAHAAR